MDKKHNNSRQDQLYDMTSQYLKRGMTRRDFLRGMAAMGVSLSSLNSLVSTVVAQEETSSQIAERIAKEKYSGETIFITREAGPQADALTGFSAPLWEERTGIKIQIVDLPAGATQYSQAITEHIAGTGAIDVIDVAPLWQADYVRAGVLEPLDDYITEFMNPADLDDMAPIYRDMGRFEGVTYGLFDDGDTLLLYYRTDLFEEHSDAFEAEYGYPLAPPTDYKQMEEIAKYFTETLGPDVYGAAFARGPEGFANIAMFDPHFKANGGMFFDPETMEPLINGPEGLRTAQEMLSLNKYMPPGITQVGPVDLMFEWLAGKFAMNWFWPPLGRWSASYGFGEEALSFVPESQVVGKTGYALLPGDITQMAVGFSLGVSSDSGNKELAYLFAQWLQSPEISLQRVLLPYALRDPYRVSHFESEEYRNAWPEAGDYLDTLLDGGNKASLDLLIPGSQEYRDTLDRALQTIWAGTDPQEALDSAASQWNEITDRLGRDSQKSAYSSYIELPGAYPSANLVDAPSNLDLG